MTGVMVRPIGFGENGQPREFTDGDLDDLPFNPGIPTTVDVITDQGDVTVFVVYIPLQLPVVLADETETTGLICLGPDGKLFCQ